MNLKDSEKLANTEFRYIGPFIINFIFSDILLTIL